MLTTGDIKTEIIDDVVPLNDPNEIFEIGK